MDELRGLKNILKKLMLLNSSRMAQIRDSWVTTKEDSAEYEERYSEQQWYKQAIEEINLQIVGKDLKISRDTLKSNIKAKLESRYDEVLEKTRQKGAGSMKRETYFFSTPDPDGETFDGEGIAARKKEVEYDYDFLESCGIKREIW